MKKMRSALGRLERSAALEQQAEAVKVPETRAIGRSLKAMRLTADNERIAADNEQPKRVDGGQTLESSDSSEGPPQLVSSSSDECREKWVDVMHAQSETSSSD